MTEQLKAELSGAVKNTMREGFEELSAKLTIQLAELSIKIDQCASGVALVQEKMSQKPPARSSKKAAETAADDASGASAASGAPATGVKLTTAKSWFLAQYQASEEFRNKYVDENLRAQLTANEKLAKTKPDARMKTEAGLAYNALSNVQGKMAEIKKEFDAVKEAAKAANAAAVAAASASTAASQ